MYNNGTLIIIDIQADNKVEILECIEASFAFMPGWKMENGSLFGGYFNTRIFAFDMTDKTFVELRPNNSYSDTMDEDEIIIKDLADISDVLEFVYLNSESIRKSYPSKQVSKLMEWAKETYAAHNTEGVVFKSSLGWVENDSPYAQLYKAKMAECHQMMGKHTDDEYDHYLPTEKNYSTIGGKSLKWPVTHMVKLKIPSKVDWKIKMAPNGVSFKSNEDIIDVHASYAATMAATAMMSLQEAHWSGE